LFFYKKSPSAKAKGLGNGQAPQTGRLSQLLYVWWNWKSI